MAKIKTKNTLKTKTKRKRKKINWSILWQNAATFLIAQIIGVFIAIALLTQRIFTPVQMPVPWYYFIFSFLIATLFIILAIKFLKGGRFFILIFYFVIVLGTQIVFNTFMPFEISLALALMVLILRLTTPRIWTHNLAIVLGLAGISASIGIDITPLGVVVILIILSIYDYIAVYKTKTMVKMFKGMLQRGVIFSIIIPTHIKNWIVDLKKVKTREGFMFLGTGDIALPMIFAAAALKTGLISSIFIILGALIGVLSLHVLFAIQKRKAAMPALPPIALFSILGYLISLYII